uniref:Phospho-N-acetylmuramoyl-pentapeptide-transferase n=1 Tax=candidate division WOR-3 bacterium TaxID=2052148 RepID=A0A7C6A9I7_UNCW3
MLYLLLYPLKQYFGPLNLFRYITFRALYAGGLSLILCLIFGPLVIKWIKRLDLGQNIREEVPERHKMKAGTPTMGGIMILWAIIIAVLLFADLTNQNIQLGLLTLIGLGTLGYVDDYIKIRKARPRGLQKRVKLLVQFTLAFVIGLILYFFPTAPAIKTKTNFLLFKNVIIDFGVTYIPFIILVIVGSTNAVNLTDGLDGLAIGLVSAAAATYAFLTYVAGHSKLAQYLNIIYAPGVGEMTVFALAIVGAGLGFLWFNSYPAQIFMGDTGSLPLGGLIGLIAVLCKQEVLLLIVGGVFVIEVFSVLIQVIYFHATSGRRVFKMAPLHHHFELCGYKEPKIVTRFWILAILFGLFAISTLKIR